MSLGSDSSSLSSRIDDLSARVGVIGLGYVGLPLAHALCEGGFRVLGLDTDPEKITMLADGTSYLEHLGPDLVTQLASGDKFEATTDFSRMDELDVVVVCVPTPLGPHREPDLSFVYSAADSCGATLHAGQLLILESTTYPGTTRDEFLPRILAARKSNGDLQPGRDFFVAYSPEREDPGRPLAEGRKTPRLVGALDSDSAALATAFYSKCFPTVINVGRAEIAEASKILENTFRSVNIAFVNEMKVILEEMGIDVWEVIEAASTKPFGFMPFYPGPGLGGHCIPVDPFYLSWKAKEVGRPTRFIELAGSINQAMPEYVVTRTLHALNAQGVPMKGARVLVLGLAYKPDVNDTRESPSFELIQRLIALGAEVDYSDPHLPVMKATRRHDYGLTSVDLTPESIASFDVLLLATNHSSFDYDLIAKHARLVVDTRNAFKHHAEAMGERLVRA